MSPSAVHSGTPSSESFPTPVSDTASAPPPQVAGVPPVVLSSSSKLTPTSTSTLAYATQPKRFSLDQLPTELLYPIASYLVPDAPLTTRFALRATGTWEFRDENHQWADWLAGHHNLLAFAMACRRLAAISSPLLYHTLMLRDQSSLITLYQRIARRPEIKYWIRSINCFVNLGGQSTINHAMEEWEQRMGGKDLARHYGMTPLLTYVKSEMVFDRSAPTQGRGNITRHHHISALPDNCAVLSES